MTKSVSSLSKIQSPPILVSAHALLTQHAMAVVVAGEAHGASRADMHLSVIKKRFQRKWLMTGVIVITLKKFSV
ncbi:hypothetical protein BEE12_20675 (plasmid) [Pantoea agglomerans]|nr:hypothetical protein BEE12_20675 [Pantoea agglomerans]